MLPPLERQNIKWNLLHLKNTLLSNLKKDRDKRFIKNWSPISLLNIDSKTVSKALPTSLKRSTSFFNHTSANSYLQNRFISETGRLISDILEITDTLNLTGYLVAIDIEKVFDSLNHGSPKQNWFWS